MAEITACKENMSEQKADGSPAKKKIRTLDDAPNESHEKKGAAQLAKEKRDQEYKNWVVAAPQLYDVCMQKHLRWPSLTVEWLPGYTDAGREGWNRHQLLLGTHTDGEENSLLVVAVDLPDVETEIDTRAGEFGKDTSAIALTLPHPGGEVNRARHCPQQPSLVATRPASKVAYVFDIAKAAEEGPSATPWLTLRGHGDEGFGCAWSPHVNGQLTTCANDGTICGWDIATAKGGGITPTYFASRGESAVADVQYSPQCPFTICAAGDDKALVFWDLRTQGDKCSSVVENAHDGDINALAYPNFGEDDQFRLLSASADRTVKLWDTRHLSKPVHTFATEGDCVQVQWCPHDADVFVTCGADRGPKFWDVSRIGASVEPDSDEDEPAPPELVFAHGGHKAPVSDFSLSPNESWLAASVSEDNVLQVAWVSEAIFGDVEGDGEDVGTGWQSGGGAAPAAAAAAPAAA